MCGRFTSKLSERRKWFPELYEAMGYGNQKTSFYLLIY